VTKDSGHSGDGGSQPPKTRASAPDGSRRNNVLPIDRGKRVARRPWPIASSAISLNSGAGLLIVIGVLCGLLISESDTKSPIVAPKPDVKVEANAKAQAPAAPPSLAKPSPAIRADATTPGGSPAAKTPDSRASNRITSYSPARFQATHKKVFGGCTGELELTTTALHFRCPKKADLDFPINEIARANQDGVVLKSGEKYHFAIANHTKDQAEAIFIAWLSKVQPASQQNSVF
jgi:hypothetical protein